MKIKRVFFVFLFPIAPAFIGALIGGGLAQYIDLAGVMGWIIMTLPALVGYVSFMLLIMKNGVKFGDTRIDL